MSGISTRFKHAVRDFGALTAVTILGLAISALVFALVRSYYINVDRQQFQRDANYYTASFKTNIERHVTSMAAIHAFVSAAHDVTRWEFSAFAHQILPRNSGFRAVLWLPHIDAAERKAFEASMQRDGLFGLRLRELNSSANLVNADIRPAYLPVAFVEPFEESGSLIGVDLSSNPIYGPLFETAKRTRRAAVSLPLSRALVETNGPAIAVVFPLFKKSGLMKGQVYDDLKGYALGVLQLNRVLQDSMGNLTSLRAAVGYREKEAAGVILAGNRNKKEALSSWLGTSEFSQVVPFEIAGENFSLALQWGDQRDPLTRLYVPAQAALLVLAVVALLAQSMLTTILRKRKVEEAVIERTAELRTLNNALLGEVEQRRQVESELRLARDKAEAANRAKSAFLSTMSHELRTPLNAIIGFSSILIQAGPGSDQHTQDYVSEINSSGLKLLELINDILEITQMDQNEEPSDLVFVSDLIESAIAGLAPLATASGVTLQSEVSESLPPLRGDSRRLQKTLRNLLSNAIKFTPSGGWAQVSAHGSATRVVIEVRDSGIGMSAIADGINIFSQGDTSLTRRHEGVGLGLTYVKRVADQHDARLEITSEVGVGTCVRLIFAAEQPANLREVA